MVINISFQLFLVLFLIFIIYRLFKRVHNATTAEGHWRFKRGQYALLMQHAAKAVGAANVPIQA